MKLSVRGVVSLTFKSTGHNIYLCVHKHVNELRQNNKSQLTFHMYGGVAKEVCPHRKCYCIDFQYIFSATGS